MSHAQDMTDAVRMATKMIEERNKEITRLEAEAKAGRELVNKINDLEPEDARHFVIKTREYVEAYDAATEGKA